MTTLALLLTADDLGSPALAEVCRFVRDLSVQLADHLPGLTIRSLVPTGSVPPAGLPGTVERHGWSGGDGWLGAWSLAGELQRCHRAAPFELVLTMSSAAQRGAGLWARRDRQAAAVLRLWTESEPLQKNWLDRLTLNNGTAVNILPSHATADHMRGHLRPAGAPKLDNPYILHHGLPLQQDDAERLADALNGLINPARQRLGLHPARSHSHIRLTYITHFYLNQNRSETVSALLRHYASYDPALLDQIHFVIVDDGSPLDVQPPEVDLNLTWLRINEDIRWNQGGARNLGVTYAKSDNVLVTDLDLAYPEETLRALVEYGPVGKTLFKFYEKQPDSSEVRKGHPNNFFLSRGRFMRYYGYDEEFAGHYGAEDFRFVKFQKAQGTRQKYFDRRYTYYRRHEIDRAAGYHSLTRDLSANTPVDSRKRVELERYGHEQGHSRMFLSFTWKILSDRQRATAPLPTPDSGWKRRWLWRTLLPW